MARWVAKVLECVVGTLCYTCVRDSKVVLSDLQRLRVGLLPGQQLFMISSDIVDFYPQIDLDTGILHVEKFVSSLYGPREARFVMFAIRRILEHKYFRVCLQSTSGKTVLYLHKL